MSNKQKIILYIHHGKGIGGAPLSLLYLVQSLDQRFFKPIVLFLHNSDALKMYREAGIETVGPVNRMDFPHTKIWWLRWYHAPMILKSIKDTFITLLFTAPRILKTIKPDIVHLNTSSLIAWGIAAHRTGIPVVWHIREPLADGYFGLRKWLVRTCVARYATRIVPISKHDAAPWIDLSSWGRLKPLKKEPGIHSKLHIIYNAVPPEKFDYRTNPTTFLTRHNLDATTPKILFLGGLSREKGTHVILNVFAELLKKLPSAQLLIAGAINLPRQHFLSSCLSAEATVGRRLEGPKGTRDPFSVILLGTIHDVPAAMAASNVIVFPATVGHFARPIIEAGFMKKPVVASSLAPLDELVVDKRTGFLIDPHDTQTWVDALYDLLTNQALNHKIGAEGYRFCTKRFGIEKQQKAIRALYVDLETN